MKQEFDLDLDLASFKVNEASIKAIKFAEVLAQKTGSQIPTTSQMMKYCESDVLSEAIAAMKAGKRIRLS